MSVTIPELSAAGIQEVLGKLKKRNTWKEYERQYKQELEEKQRNNLQAKIYQMKQGKPLILFFLQEIDILVSKKFLLHPLQSVLENEKIHTVWQRRSLLGLVKRKNQYQ